MTVPAAFIASHDGGDLATFLAGHEAIPPEHPDLHRTRRPRRPRQSHA